MKKFGFKSSDVKGGCIVSLDRNLKTVKYIKLSKHVLKL